MICFVFIEVNIFVHSNRNAEGLHISSGGVIWMIFMHTTGVFPYISYNYTEK